ncbi:MAG: hypothetical protein APR54_11265 [Candidatus Cloacimonas sp. SDB]|nr:MAG: hypothetical protein APR54_11265 [Candidatus Cloacimonas sp. SDB]
MKFSLFILLILAIIIVGCTEVDENGFYLEGKYKNLHKKTKSEYDEDGFNINGLNKRGFNRQYQHSSTNLKYDEDGFDYYGYDTNGYDSDGYDNLGFDVSGFDRKGFNESGFDISGFDKTGFDEEGYDRDGYNKKGFNRNGIHKVTKTRFNENGYNVQGRRNAFEKKYFVDNFGDPTKEKYIVQRVEGKFSNSATDNSPAYISFIYSGGNCLRFDINEYYPTSKAYFSSYEQYNYRLKDYRDNIVEGKTYIETSLKGCLEICDKKALNMIKRSNEVKVYIYEVDKDNPWERRDTIYSFSIDCTGFIDSSNYLK